MQGFSSFSCPLKGPKMFNPPLKHFCLNHKKSSVMFDLSAIQDIVCYIKKEIQMARTKQTARFACQPVHAQRAATGIKKKRAKAGKNHTNAPESDSQEPIEVEYQQFSLKFDNQPQCQKKCVTEPTFQCKKCKALLNYLSVLEKAQQKQSSVTGRTSRSKNLTDAEKQLIKQNLFNIWTCEFCHERNEVPQDIPIPKDQNACYLLSGAVKQQHKLKNTGEKVLIYCIDISGSMDTIYQNKGRLEAVKQAIRDEIKRMKFQGEKIKIGIVLFGSQVAIKQKSTDLKVPSNIYMDFDKMVQYSDTVQQFAFSIQTNFKQLENTISQMSTYGSTALGPGLLTSIQLAGRKRGSKVVLCTDGEANVGLLGPSFYTKVANYAKQKGVMVSILSLKGDNCNLKHLGKIAMSTGGAIMKIDPKLLGSEFNKISKENIFGTQSNLRIVVNHFFEIGNANPDEISADKTILTQDFGNFTADTELTFNFRILTNQEAEKKGVNLGLIKQKRLPMQVQLTYRNPDGSQFLQVVNDNRQLALNAADVLNDTNFALFSSSSLQKVSKLIKQEKFDEAQREITRFKSLVQQVFSKKQKPEDLKRFKTRMQRLEKVLRSKMLKKKPGKLIVGTKITATKAKTKAKAKISKRKKNTRSARMKSQESDEENEAEQQSIEAQQEQQEQDYLMQSDNEEEILCLEMRARQVD